MSLYTSTYNYVIKTLATSIYNKIQSKIISTTKDLQFWSRTITLSDYKKGSTDPITSKGVVSDTIIYNGGNNTTTYVKPTAASIESDIKTFIKNTLGFSDTTFEKTPDGNDMLSFIFALNYFLENSISKVAVSLTTTAIIYSPVTSGYANNISLFDIKEIREKIKKVFKNIKEDFEWLV